MDMSLRLNVYITVNTSRRNNQQFSIHLNIWQS